MIVIASNSRQEAPSSSHSGPMPQTATGDCCSKSKPTTDHGCAHHNSAAVVATNTAPIPAEIAPIFERYTEVQKALAADSIGGISESATTLSKLMKSSGSGYLGQKAATAAKVAQAKDINTARAEFKALSLALIQYLSVAGLAPAGYREAYCPMAKASWLQKGNEIQNPYMGKEMLRCGGFKS